MEEPGQLTPLLLRMTLASMWFGLCMSAYPLLIHGHAYRLQAVSSVVKVPVLFWVSFLSTFPIVYGICRIIRLPFSAIILWRVAGGAVAVMGLCLGPLGLFVLACGATGNYSVVVLASYGAFTIGGLVGVMFFIVALGRYDGVTGTGAGIKGTFPQSRGKLLMLTLMWAVSFGLVAAQLGWSIRPLIGWTGGPFQWFRHDRMTLYEQAYYEVQNLLHGGGAKFPEPAKP